MVTSAQRPGRRSRSVHNGIYEPAYRGSNAGGRPASTRATRRPGLLPVVGETCRLLARQAGRQVSGAKLETSTNSS